MAQRRMFSPDIIDSDEFLDMPISSQLLYFHLGMRADDDGFVSPQKVLRLVGASNDDLKVLIAKRFLLVFKSGVVVIKHWLIHNLIRKDRYKETRYLDEKNSLIVKKNGSYSELATNCQPIVNQMAPQVRLGKDRLINTITASAVEGSKTTMGNQRLEDEDVVYEQEGVKSRPTVSRRKVQFAIYNHYRTLKGECGPITVWTKPIKHLTDQILADLQREGHKSTDENIILYATNTLNRCHEYYSKEHLPWSLNAVVKNFDAIKTWNL